MALERKRQECQGAQRIRLHRAADPMIWRSVSELVELAGYRTHGTGRYAKPINTLISEGALEVRNGPRQEGLGGRVKLVRRAVDMYYNRRKDSRFRYVKWKDMDEWSRQEAINRFGEAYPWLDTADFLYPMTHGGWRNQRSRLAAGATPILAITPEEAEQKREEWRRREAGWLMENNPEL